MPKFIKVKTESGSIYHIAESEKEKGVLIFKREPKPLSFQRGVIIGSGERTMDGFDCVEAKITSPDLVEGECMFIKILGNVENPNPEDINLKETFFDSRYGWFITDPIIFSDEW